MPRNWRSLCQATRRRVKWKYGRLVCESCHTTVETGEVDHIIPASKGGLDNLTNLQLLCKPCHLAKTIQDRWS